MASEQRSEMKMWGVLLGIGLLLVALGLVFGVPLLKEFIVLLEPGVDLKTAATWAFGVTFVMFLLFAIITLLIAWVF